MQPPSAMSSNGGPPRPSAPSYANRGGQHAGRYGPGFQQQQQQQSVGVTGADGLLHDRASFELTEEDVDAIRLRFQSGTIPTHGARRTPAWAMNTLHGQGPSRTPPRDGPLALTR